MSSDNGGQAFPLATGWVEDTQDGGPKKVVTVRELDHGMTLRDYFAAKAMPILWDAYDKGYCGVIEPDTFDNDMLANGAYQIADAMLKARNA
jgi:hypothetical protein